MFEYSDKFPKISFTHLGKNPKNGKDFLYFEVPEKIHFQTDEFRTSAIHFKEFGNYTRVNPSTKEYKDFWKEEHRRCIDGYHIGRDEIPGYFYHYLNYSPIMQVPSVEDMEVNTTGLYRGDRLLDFPQFWDSDYDFFWYIEEAERVGLHASVIKARRRGYSLKIASMACRNYFHLGKSKSYLVGANDEFISGSDAILTKAWENMSFIDENTAFRKMRQVKNTDKQKRSSYLEDIAGVITEKGFMSEIAGIAIGDKPDKMRGKAGKLIGYEEGGSNKYLLQLWQKLLPSIRQGKVVFGIQIAFGTGGEEKATFQKGLEELFYSPQAYEILPVRNIWDEGAGSTYCGYFVPEYMNREGCYDSDGNSDKDKAIEEIDIIRDGIRLESKDTSALPRRIAEEPKTPREALLKTSESFFLREELLIWERKLSIDIQLQTIGVNGYLGRMDGGDLKFVPNENLVPIKTFPTEKGIDRTGCIVLYESPFKTEDNQIPENLYYIVVDPYTLDNDYGDSLGACYVIKRINELSKPDDMIVASYIARPESQDDFSKTVFDLAEYYNCKVCPENDASTGFFAYAKNNKKLGFLQEEFGILSKSGSMGNMLGRRFGVSMNDGDRKKQAMVYLKAWLYKDRGVDEEGRRLMNLHYIYDLGLIQELIKFSTNKNFNADRVSALLVAMFYKEHLINIQISSGPSIWTSEFFTRFDSNFAVQNYIPE